MLRTVDCTWVQLIGDGLFIIIIITSLFSLLFALLPCTENYPSSDKLISLLGWVAVPTDSWFPARALLVAVQGNGQQGLK